MGNQQLRCPMSPGRRHGTGQDSTSPCFHWSLSPHDHTCRLPLLLTFSLATCFKGMVGLRLPIGQTRQRKPDRRHLHRLLRHAPRTEHRPGPFRNDYLRRISLCQISQNEKNESPDSIGSLRPKGLVNDRDPCSQPTNRTLFTTVHVASHLHQKLQLLCQALLQWQKHTIWLR